MSVLSVGVAAPHRSLGKGSGGGTAWRLAAPLESEKPGVHLINTGPHQNKQRWSQASPSQELHVSVLVVTHLSVLPVSSHPNRWRQTAAHPSLVLWEGSFLFCLTLTKCSFFLNEWLKDGFQRHQQDAVICVSMLMCIRVQIHTRSCGAHPGPIKRTLETFYTTFI